MAGTSTTTQAAASTASAAAPHVAVIGGGIAGLSAALKLRQCGFQVTLYEAKETLGGNLSSELVDGVYHDVYPHMFCSWYYNFWELFETDLGLSRADNFFPHKGVQLRRIDWPDYRELENASSLRSALANLTSGVRTPAEMFLVGFSMLDLASRAFNRDSNDVIDQLDVNGFLYSRGYATETVAQVQNYILETIWSIRSDVTTATSYQDFIRNMVSFPHPTPYAWLLEGSIAEKIIEPLAKKLNCEIRLGATVTSVEIVGGKPSITFVPSGGGSAPPVAPETADYVVLAVPGTTLANLVMTGAEGARIVDFIPDLSELQHAQSVAIPVVDLYLNKKLEGVPKAPIGFLDSSYKLTTIDISQLWTNDPNMKDRTALVLAASNPDAIPTLDCKERGYLMIKELLRYLPKGSFNPGGHWGDPASDICWDKSHYRSNNGNRLFVNDVSSCRWRPHTTYDSLPNVFFAGDFCRTDVDMATIEVAVQSGVLAAKAVQAREAKVRKLMGPPITDIKHEAEYGAATFLAGKLVALPVAYAAAAWAMGADAKRRKDHPPGFQTVVVTPDAYSSSTAPLLLPLAYVQDFWETAYWLAATVVSDATKSGPQPPPGAHQATLTDALANLAGHALVGLGDCLQGVSSRQPTRGDPAPDSDLGGAVSSFLGQALSTALTMLAPQTAVDPASQERPPRRGRAKQ
jgi:hypothetical protein